MPVVVVVPASVMAAAVTLRFASALVSPIEPGSTTAPSACTVSAPGPSIDAAKVTVPLGPVAAIWAAGPVTVTGVFRSIAPAAARPPPSARLVALRLMPPPATTVAVAGMVTVPA